VIAFVRWTLFIFIGLPFQLLVFIIYPFLWVYWRLCIYEEVYPQKEAPHQDVPVEVKMRANGWLLDNADDHGAFTMYGAIKERGLELLNLNGDFMRRFDDHGDHNLKKVSGDVVVAWCFAATHKGLNLKRLEWTIRSAAWNYLKHLGTRSYDEKNNGWVSNRCNNLGINFCPDSDLFKIGQPMGGPQFYTNSCLFALASLFSYRWKLVFWIHWILLGGWFWMWFPIIYTKSKPVHYTRDITMKALWVHKFVFGDQFWISLPMWTITTRLSTHENPLFRAMYGWIPGNITPAMNAFFSQRHDAGSIYVKNDMNPVLGRAIMDLYQQSKDIEYGKT